MTKPDAFATFEKIWIDRQSLSSKVAQRIRERYDSSIIEVVDANPFQDHKGLMSPEQFNRSKRLLYVKPFVGHFFKRCPGATQKKVLTCCNYHVLNLGQQCNFNCSYCYLQSYLNTPTMQVYSNIDQALTELREMASQFPDHPFRVGTGEVIDSLSLDPVTLYSRDLIEFFCEFPKWTLEFKTKSASVDQFLDVPHAGNIVVSWSINPAAVINSEEHGTARLPERLEAASKCRDRGFQVAFHIDPMIYFEDWQEHYRDLVREITSRFEVKDVHVISVGALRFQPEQRHLMRDRFGMQSMVTRAEMLPSDGGKMRYDQALRQEMFKFVKDEFASYGSQWRIFFCMETPETWISSFAATPMQVPELKTLFRPLPKISSLDSAQPN
ncbi:MAG: radical SAM protein [Bdellovibrio sp.]|jgi:spore photoproduct lyase